MVILRTLLLAASAANVLAHPAQEARRDERLSYQPGGPMIKATVTPMSYNPGGPMIKATDTPMSYNPGGPMKTAADSPMPYNPGGPMKSVQTTTAPASTASRTPIRPGKPPASDIRDCTVHMTVSATKVLCPNDHIDWIYPATKTETAHVDCGGCDQVYVYTTPFLFCPANIITTSVSVATPSTSTTTVCSPTTAYSQLTESHAHPTRPSWGPKQKRADAAEAACPTTLYVDPSTDNSGVTYQNVVTATSRVACGGCPLVVATRLGGQGPLKRPNPGTVVPAATTTTTYVCG